MAHKQDLVEEEDDRPRFYKRPEIPNETISLND